MQGTHTPCTKCCGNVNCTDELLSECALTFIILGEQFQCRILNLYLVQHLSPTCSLTTRGCIHIVRAWGCAWTLSPMPKLSPQCPPGRPRMAHFGTVGPQQVLQPLKQCPGAGLVGSPEWLWQASVGTLPATPLSLRVLLTGSSPSSFPGSSEETLYRRHFPSLQAGQWAKSGVYVTAKS